MKHTNDTEIVKIMIRMYCKSHHHPEGYLCPECEELLEYVKYRRSLCPFGDDKPFCANCKIHCYKPDMQEKIKKVMRFSGPLISFVHPVIGANHIIETVQTKIKNKKQAKERQKKIEIALQRKKEMDELKAKQALEASQKQDQQVESNLENSSASIKEETSNSDEQRK